MLDIFHWNWSARARADANGGRWSEDRFQLDLDIRFGRQSGIDKILRDLDGVRELGLELVRVASVETDDLGVAFERTNSIHVPWTQNTGLRCFVSTARSTSIGDLMRSPAITSESDASPGKWSVVLPVGFEVLPEELAALLDQRFNLTNLRDKPRPSGRGRIAPRQ